MREVAAEFIFSREGSFQFGSKKREDEIRFFRNDHQLEAGALAQLPGVFQDWLAIAHAVYLSDRVLRRPDPGWSRELKLKIPVRLPLLWRRVEGKLLRLLRFLTGDRWHLEFTAAERGRPTLKQDLLKLEPFDTGAEVALFSGGLDSLAGVVSRLEDDPSKRFLLVSAATGPLILNRQNTQIAFLKRAYPGRISRLSIQHGFQFEGANFRGESSQRGRGFLHLSIGCIAALLTGARRLHVYENGIGALNLPLRSQLGAQASRPINPITLRMMSEFCSALLAHARQSLFCGIENPFEHSTKARMCRVLARHGTISSKTHSCDHTPREAGMTGKDHCGVCSSCLLRRLSLREAQLPDPPAQYTLDVFSAQFIAPQSATPFHLIAEQISEFERLSQGPWKDWARRYAMLPQIVASLRLRGVPAPIPTICMLYSSYVREWRAFESACKFRLP